MKNRTLQLIPLEQETRSVLPTAEAARHLLRADQTLRAWAFRGDGPIQPVRINGRLGWPVAEIKRVLGQSKVPQSKGEWRDKLQHDVEQYLASGKEIKQVESGHE